MKWQRIRLELAPNPEFPGGSASRAYVIHAPVDGDGRIGEASPAGFHHPRIQRMWPNEPDLSGQLVRRADGWAISYGAGPSSDESGIHIENQVLLVGEHATFTEPDGQQRRYRVVSVT